MREFLRHGVPVLEYPPNFEEWFNDLPSFFKCWDTLEETYRQDKKYFYHLLEAYKSGKGLKITTVEWFK
jgi:hypothetical protein